MKYRRRAILVGKVSVFAVACLYVIWSCSLGYLSEDLVEATLQEDYSRMELLIKFGADPNFKFMGTTPVLQYAIDHKDSRATAILIDRGANLQILDLHFQRLFAAQKFHRSVENELAKIKRDQ